MVADVIRRWIDGYRNRSTRKGRARADGPRPRLEELEGRILPSVSPFLNGPAGVTNHWVKTITEPNGQILEIGTGQIGTSGNQEFAVARFNADGSPDTTFGIGGEVVIPVATTDVVTDALVQPDGKIVVAGSAVSFGYPPPAGPGEVTPQLIVLSPSAVLLRFDADGTLDSSFGNGGVIEASFAPVFDAVALQGDGKLVVDGPSFTVARYDSDGVLDAGFAQGGYGRLVFGNADSSAGLSIGADGTILLTGQASDTSMIPPLSPAWYQDEAELGRLFGATIEPTPPPGGWFSSGWYSEGWDYACDRPASVQFNPDGSLDSSYGTDGVLLGAPLPPPSGSNPMPQPPSSPTPTPPPPTDPNPAPPPTDPNPAAPTAGHTSVPFLSVAAPPTTGSWAVAFVAVPAAPTGAAPAPVAGAPVLPAGPGDADPFGVRRSGGAADPIPTDQTADPLALPPADAQAGPNAALDAVFAEAPAGGGAGRFAWLRG